jgi:hypothetical protein
VTVSGAVQTRVPLQIELGCGQFWALALAGGTGAWMRRHRRRARAGRSKMPAPIHPMSHQRGKWRVTAAAMAHTASPASTQTAKSRSTYCQRGRRLVHGRPSFSSSHRQNVRWLISPIPLSCLVCDPKGPNHCLSAAGGLPLSRAVLTESSLPGADTANAVPTTAVNTGRSDNRRQESAYLCDQQAR